MLQIFALHMKERLSRTAFHRLLTESSIERQTKVQRFLKYEDAARSLVGDRLAREVIANRIGQSVNDIRFEVDPYGKPHLVDRKELICFNVSHSGDWIVCAIDVLPVGIDLERIKPIDIQIALPYFSKQERAELMSNPLEQRLAHFYELWTMKESFIKADGRGLSIPLHSFTVRKNGSSSQLIMEDKLSDFQLKQYVIDAAYKLAVCSKRGYFPKQVMMVELNSMLQIG
ncbi:4'-phosphopantetheinyl transferase family protein [Paenibacillus sp. FJAT-27812]|uniref:4'-phosphopantetheinyl transferase family protein n=1 Tax=Paenibacillus sp. FJAT-27812 TaxID=1684143 RepID=UPI0006A782AE|nr:4'-phosphopantetheinyl transferase superfamily protein [Paenibacillus sp. FJAT-27812]